MGAGLRTYTVDGVDVLDGYAAREMCNGGRGQLLVPWPNRIRDGQYRFDGTDQQTPLSEPERGNAIHGLLRWRNWAALERASDRVLMGIRLHPMTGWPFPLEVSISYSLADDGLTVETRVRNAGPTPCPFGSGQHPYLSPGAGPLDGCTLEATASTRILVDEQRALPVGREPVDGTEFDFRSPRKIGGLQLDHGFCDLEPDPDGLAWARRVEPVRSRSLPAGLPLRLQAVEGGLGRDLGASHAAILPLSP